MLLKVLLVLCIRNKLFQEFVKENIPLIDFNLLSQVSFKLANLP